MQAVWHLLGGALMNDDWDVAEDFYTLQQETQHLQRELEYAHEIIEEQAAHIMLFNRAINTQVEAFKVWIEDINPEDFEEGQAA